MTAISDDFMKHMMGKTKQYCIVILKPGPHKNDAGAEKIIWEHGRRNFALREEGLLSIVCPIPESTLAGVGIFNATEAFLAIVCRSPWSIPTTDTSSKKVRGPLYRTTDFFS